jgi:hypothetical protein
VAAPTFGSAWTALRRRDAAAAVSIAANPRTSPGALFLLHRAASMGGLPLVVRSVPGPAIHRALAANPGAPTQLLRRLTRNGRWDVRRVVVTNPSLPRTALERRVNDRRESWAIHEAIAASEHTPVDLLDQLVDRHAGVRLALAANPNTEPRTLRALVGGSDPYVRAVAAQHPSLPSEVLRSLLADADAPPWLLRAAASNPSCPPDQRDETLTWLALVAGHGGDATFDPRSCLAHPGTGPEGAAAWYEAEADHAWAVDSPLWRVRATRARRIRAPEAAERFATDPDDRVRYAIAVVATVYRRRLHEMCDDPDADVRGAARLRAERLPPPTGRQRMRSLLSFSLSPRRLALALAIPIVIGLSSGFRDRDDDRLSTSGVNVVSEADYRGSYYSEPRLRARDTELVAYSDDDAMGVRLRRGDAGAPAELTITATTIAIHVLTVDPLPETDWNGALAAGETLALHVDIEQAREVRISAIGTGQRTAFYDFSIQIER